MGLLGCPASFQRLMETVVNGLANVIVYINDLLVHSATHPEHPWAVKSPLGWTCVGPSEPKFKGDTSHSVWVHNILIRDWLSKPFELPIQEIEQHILDTNAGKHQAWAVTDVLLTLPPAQASIDFKFLAFNLKI